TVNWTGTAAGTSGSVTLPYTITGLAAGTYNIDFTVGAGCVSNTLVQVLTDPAVPTITVGTVVDPTTCLGTDGTIQITGTGTGTVNWTGTAAGTSGAITLPYTVTGLAAGTYNIDFTVGAGCVSNTLVQVLVDPTPPVIAVGTVTNPTICLASDGTIQITGAGAGTVNWTGTASGTSGATTLPYTITGLAAGSYTIDFTNAAGCTSNAVVQVLVDPSAPTIAVGTVVDPTICLASDGSIQITGTGMGTVNWTGTAAGTSGSVTLPYTITGLAAGTYNIDFTVGAGCVSNTLVQVLVDPTPPAVPIITPSGPTAICAGGSVDLTSSYGFGNLWSTTEITPTITVSTAGAFTVTHTDVNGCSATSATIAITVNPLPPVPTITPSGPTTVCGGTVDLTSSQPTGILWSTTEVTPTITVATSGSYTVTYTDGNACSSTSLPTVVTINPVPVIVVGTVVDPVLCGTATGTIEVTGPGTGTVSWTGTASGTSGAITLPYTITGLAAGSYDVTYVDGNGCTSNTFTQVIVDGAAPTAPIVTPSGPLTFCAGGSVDLASSYGTGNLWSTTEVTATITVATTGTYTVTYTDGFGCSSVSAPIAVVVNALPSAPTITPSGPTTFCAGGSVDLTSSEPLGNFWSTTEGTQVITVSTTGTYDVTYTDGNGCSAISTPINVTVNALPAAPIITPSGPTSICAGGSVDLSSSEATGNTWSTLEVTQLITVSTTGTYDVTYLDGNGCSATSAPVNITVNPNPAAPVITPSGPTILCAGQTVDLSSSQPSGNVWSTLEVTPVITVGATGSYTVTFTDGNGCSATSAPIAISGGNQPTVSAGSDQTICQGESVTLTGAGAVTYVWDNGVFDNIPFTPAVGSILYTVTGVDGNGCTNTASVTVNVSATPTPTITTDSITCVGYGPSTLIGSPVGGIYLGAHVSGNQFDPTSAGVGTHTVFYELTNIDGCVGTASTMIIVEACASINDIDGTQVKVYPNPMQHVLNVEVPGDFTITMHDARGRIVYQDGGTDLITIDTGIYEMGVYMLTISSDSINTMLRVIKQ
ncbi:MAG: hypothetical protein ACI837_000221, partial [Crocinitomicaceae bacterium]